MMNKLVITITSILSSIGGFIVKIWDKSSIPIKNLWEKLKEKLVDDPDFKAEIRKRMRSKKLNLLRRGMAILVSGTFFCTLYASGVLETLFPWILWGSPMYLWISAIGFAIQIPLILVNAIFDITQPNEKFGFTHPHIKKISSLVGTTEIGHISFLKFPSPKQIQSFSYQNFQRLPKISKLIDKWNSHDLIQHLQNYTINVEPDIENKGLHKLLEKVYDKPFNLISDFENDDSSEESAADRIIDRFKTLNNKKRKK